MARLNFSEGRAMKILALLVVLLALSGCAAPLVKQEALFHNIPDRKECYAYDTSARANARNLPTSVGLGILGGLFPPLLIFTAIAAGASAAADLAALPTKCGLTFSEAVKEAWTVSHYEKTTAIWRQKGGGSMILAKHSDDAGDCTKHEVTMTRWEAEDRKQAIIRLTVCRNEQGVPEIKESVDEASA
jgi:hypothetical protein